MMRRGVSENHQGQSAAGTSLVAPSSRSRNVVPTKTTSLSNKAKKRRVFYVLLLGIVIFQSFIIPWLLASSARHETNFGATSAVVGPADGSFNGHAIYLREETPFHSSVHCVGETHDANTAWMYRSCEFTNLCLDTKSNEFFVVESPTERELQKKRVLRSYISTELSSSSKNTEKNLTVALGGINPRWIGQDFNQGVDKVQWFPKRLSRAPSQYYVMDDHVVLIPFHSFAAHNVGHMLWDDFLPLYTLLQIFGWSNLMERSALLEDPYQLFLLRVDTLPLLYGTCEMRRKKGKQCAENFEKFLPLLGVDPKTFSTVRTAQFQTNHDSATSVVCAKHAMAGLGMLTDHGLKDHGWLMPKETHAVQNTAKGSMLYQFRNTLVRNLNLPIVPPPSTPLRIVLSAHSSGDPPRDVHFLNQQKILADAFPNLSIQHVELSIMGLREQVELVSQTRIFVSTCGGGSMTATFLPKGSTLILYYNEDGGYDFANNFNLTGDPAFLDWDLFNNMAYLRVHWLPIGSMNTREGWETLVLLIQHELTFIMDSVTP